MTDEHHNKVEKVDTMQSEISKKVYFIIFNRKFHLKITKSCYLC